MDGQKLIPISFIRERVPIASPLMSLVASRWLISKFTDRAERQFQDIDVIGIMVGPTGRRNRGKPTELYEPASLELSRRLSRASLVCHR
jgi:hypothetical protein